LKSNKANFGNIKLRRKCNKQLLTSLPGGTTPPAHGLKRGEIGEKDVDGYWWNLRQEEYDKVFEDGLSCLIKKDKR
jgi:hypothetical protein